LKDKGTELNKTNIYNNLVWLSIT